MAGYLLNFYKYSPINKEEIKDDSLKKIFRENEYSKSVVWSKFDRLEVRKIEEFKQFRESGNSEKSWIGERQFAMIYDIGTDVSKKLTYDETSASKGVFAFHKTGTDNECNLRFFGISMIDLTPEAYSSFYSSSNPGNYMYEKFTEAIDEIINSCDDIHKEAICYDIFGTLGGNDLVIIWLTYQFEDIIKILEAIRQSYSVNSNIGVVANVSTIMGIRDISDIELNFKDAKGYFNIKLTKREGCQHAVLKESLSIDENSVETLFGEHDISIKIPCANVENQLYTENGFLHMMNSKFITNFFQANTELSAVVDYNNLPTYNFNLTNTYKYNLVSWKEKNNIQKKIEKIVAADLFLKASYLTETIWILYEDYIKNITSTFSYPWTRDLHTCFYTALEYLENLVVTDELSTELKYECVEFLISNMRQMILHVAQANRLFFEVPNTHLRHTGTYSKILRTYNGIIKQLLKLAYAIPKTSKQSQLIPFITFDVTPIAKSDTCPDIHLEGGICENKILVIKLPYEALVDIPKFINLLAHEIYHYIAPADRDCRNKIFGTICISLFIEQIALQYIDEKKEILKNYIDEQDIEAYDSAWFNNSVSKNIKASIAQNAYQYTLANYASFDQLITADSAKAEWQIYFDIILKKFGKDINKCSEFIDLLYTFMRNLDFEQIFSTLREHFDNGTLVTNRLVDLLRTSLEDDSKEFKTWLAEYNVDKGISVMNEVQYALREAFADYFMIQSMKISRDEYLRLILDYHNLISNKKSVDMRQKYRLGITIDFIFDHYLPNRSIEDGKKLTKGLFDELNHDTFSKEEREYIAKTYGEYYSALHVYGSAIMKCFKELDFKTIGHNCLGCKEKFSEILKETHTYFTPNFSKEDDFKRNIWYIEHFQIQPDLKDVYENISFRAIPSNYSLTNPLEELITDSWKELERDDFDKFTKTVSNVQMLLNKLEDAINLITDGNVNQSIWYRGHESTKYLLIPSLYRMKNSIKTFYDCSLRDVFEDCYDAFKAKSYGTSEIYQDGNNTVIGVMASMQHYSIPTNILDWSTSAFVGMYFAVEHAIKTLNEGNEEEEVKSPEDAVIWLLNPLRLNIAYDWLASNRRDMISKTKENKYPIPFLMDNTEKYKEFFPFTEPTKGGFPLAVYTPYVNPRIKSQSGTFTMFSLDVEGSIKDGEKTFEDYDLLNLQKRYKELSKDEFKPFLASIIIKGSCIYDLAKWLIRMGIEKPSIYPELTNIATSIKENLRKYYNEYF